MKACVDRVVLDSYACSGDRMTEGRLDEGLAQLRTADQQYKGYSMENKLHFRMHRSVCDRWFRPSRSHRRIVSHLLPSVQLEPGNGKSGCVALRAAQFMYPM